MIEDKALICTGCFTVNSASYYSQLSIDPVKCQFHTCLVGSFFVRYILGSSSILRRLHTRVIIRDQMYLENRSAPWLPSVQ